MADQAQVLLSEVGTMNPNNDYAQTHLYLDPSDNALTIAEQINDLNLNSIRYPNLIGLVIQVDKVNVGEAPPKKTKEEKKSDPPPTVLQRSVAYVYIDVIHGSIRKIINSQNARSLLTQVEITGPTIPSIKSRVLVAFKSNSLSEATLVKFLDASEQQAIPTPPQTNPRLKPCVELKKPMKKSTPVRVINGNVGYVQALYVLARWQSKYPDYKITEIIYPFEPDDTASTRTISGIAFQVLKKSKDANAEFLKKLENNSNPQKQWATSVKAFFNTTITYKQNNNPGIIIKFETKKKSALDVSAIGGRFELGYKAKKIDEKSFLLDFSTENSSVEAKLRLTQRNLSRFRKQFEKVIHSPVVDTTTNTAPSVRSVGCGRGARTVQGPQGPNRYFRNGNTSAQKRFCERQGWSYYDKADKQGHIKVNPEWEKQYLVRRKVTFSNGKSYTIRMHKLVADIFVQAVLEASKESGYIPDKNIWSYAPRHVGRKINYPISLHSFGMAIDFDSQENPMIKCKTKQLDSECARGEIRKFPKFIDIMNKYGFIWGGDYTYFDKTDKTRKPYPDDMHFEFDIKRLGTSQ